LAIDPLTPAATLPPSGIDYQILAEGAADVLLQVDADGVIEWASHSTASITGFEATALAGLLGLSIVHPDDRSDFASASQLALLQGRSHTDVRIGSHTAGWTWHSIVIRRMEGEAGTRVIVSGRSVEVRLPAVVGAVRAQRLPAGSNLAQAPAPVRAAGQKVTVLLIDDEPLVRAMAARMVRDLGYEVVQAPDAGAALALTDEELANVGVLLSDVVMPGIGGLQLAAMLDERRPGLPTLFMSGYVPAAGVEAAFHRTATGFLTKPFTRAELATALEAVLAVRATPELVAR
jgi:CheY-like chemotaxis protein